MPYYVQVELVVPFPQNSYIESPTDSTAGKAMISPPSAYVDPRSGCLAGEGIIRSERRLRDLVGLYVDEESRRQLDQDQIVYRVEFHTVVPESTVGGLFFGTSFLEPGRVGDEYFMTKGHFHANRERGEYYWGIAGAGALILMDETRRCWAEDMMPGSLHYIPGRVAHRLANTGDTTLAVGACWPADAGHDYETIAQQGFSARLYEIAGLPQLIPEDKP